MMKSQDQETLSALLDNEADELELRRVLKHAGDDPELADAWQRMSLVQAVLHDDNVKISRQLNLTGREFGAAVMQALEHEPVPQTDSVNGGGPGDAVITGDSAGHKQVSGAAQWAQPLAKLGIAASVAVAFFLGMQTAVHQPGAGVTAPVAQQQSVEQPGDAGSNATTLASNVEPVVREVDPEARQRLEEYIQSVSITREEAPQSDPLQDSRLYRLVNEVPAQQ